MTIELCAAVWQTKHFNVLIIVLYRSPSGELHNFLSSLTDALESIYNKKCSIVVLADFNIHFERDVENVQKLNNIMLSVNSKPYVNVPTRGNAILDNIYTGISDCQYAVFSCIVSDHNYVIFKLIGSKEKNENCNKRIRSINESTMKNFEKCLLEEDWNQVHKITNFTESFSFFIVNSCPILITASQKNI